MSRQSQGGFHSSNKRVRSSAGRPALSARFRPALEQLETRATPAGWTITVNTVNDADFADNFLSLREAIEISNANNLAGLGHVATPLETAQAAFNQAGGTNTIKFDILNGPATISLSAALPDIQNNSVVIDGTPPAGKPNQTVILDGTNAGAVSGLTIKPNNCTVQVIQISNFEGDGIYVDSASGTKIGVAGGANVLTLINMNEGNGIRITGTGAAATVVNCYIGTDRAGTAAAPNDENGILVQDHGFASIGNYDAQQSLNVISGNKRAGIKFTASSGNNTASGNYIGTDKDGKFALPNQNGVVIYSSNNQIGQKAQVDGNGVISRAANVISGNTRNGISVYDSGTETGSANKNTIIGNFIGVQADGVTGQGNLMHGIEFSGPSDGNRVGQDPNAQQSGDTNVISANAWSGVYASDSGTTGIKNLTIWKNNIGTGKDPTNNNVKLGNFSYGVYVENAKKYKISKDVVKNNQVDDIKIKDSGNEEEGGEVSENVIGNAGDDGIDVENCTNVVIFANFVGTDDQATPDLGNAANGIHVTNSSDVTISANVVAANDSDGICIESSDTITIAGNFIGTDAGGVADLGNGGNGIYLDHATNVTIGGTDTWTVSGGGDPIWTPSNVIVHNGGSGVAAVQDSGSNYAIVVEGNLVAYNSADGIALTGTTHTVRDDVIYANVLNGVKVSGNGTAIQACHIGTNLALVGGLGNGRDGVFLTGATNTMVGGTGASQSDVIWNNGACGVGEVGGYSGNSILSNSIYNNGALGIDLGEDGVTDSGLILPSGGNGFGSFHGAANTQYLFQFFVSPMRDPSWYGEGRDGAMVAVMYFSFQTDANGDLMFQLNCGNSGQWLSGTATNTATGTTSEFCHSVLVT